MKKHVILCIVLLCLFLVMLVSCNSSIQAQEEYCYKINSVIKDIDFVTAKVNDSKITLYDSENQVVKEIPFEAYDAQIPILYIKKTDEVIRFICSGDVDDENGIIFINDASNNILDGIKTIKRIGGNSYEYSTRD